MSGRRPIPTKIKEARGNPGHRPLNKLEPDPSLVDLSTPSEFLGAHGKQEWLRVVASLPDGVVTGVDVGLLEAYCDAYDQWRSSMVLARVHPVVETPNGALQTSPYVSIARNARRDMLRLGAELGITPSSRSRVQIKQAEATDDEAAQIIGF